MCLVPLEVTEISLGRSTGVMGGVEGKVEILALFFPRISFPLIIEDRELLSF